MTHADLIEDIERAALVIGLAPATITSRAVNNSRLYARLKGGKSCTITVAAKVRDWIAENEKSTAA